MRIRFALGALFAAVALTAGLVVSAGTASADAPAHGGIPCTPAAGSTSCTPVTPGGHTLPSCTVVAPATTCSDPFHHFPGGGFPSHGFPGGFNGGLGNGSLGLDGLNLLNGNVLVLGDGAQADVCDYPSWQPFYDHWGSHFGGLRDQLNELRYQQLLTQANCGNNGDDLNGLTLINGNLINLGSLGVLGGNTVNVCDYPNYGSFSRFGMGRFGGDFNGFGNRFGHVLGGNGWNQLRLRARCQPQIVVIPGSDTTTVVQAPPAPVTAPPVPAASPEAAAPQTATAPSQVSRVPAGSIDTGDGSAPDIN